MRPRKTFLQFLCDPTNSGTFYVDINGVLQTTNIPTPLQKSAEGWFNTELKFVRSAKYFGLNRTFGIPLKFVGDGAAILRELFYKKRGIEQLVMLVILKWNPDNDVYELYYKGLIDLSKMKDLHAEGIQVNVMEGGIVQLLKAYENTKFEIPCDGSIPENIKVKYDGILFQDVFHYQVVDIDAQDHSGAFFIGAILPAIFISNDGDNIGIQHGDPTYEVVPALSEFSFLETSGNWIFSSEEAVSVRIKGNLVVSPNNVIANDNLLFEAKTSLHQNIVLIPPQSADVDHTVIYYFDKTINLAANEKLFLFFFSPKKLSISNFEISFNSKYKPSNAWGITGYDLYKVLIRNICQLASTSVQTFNFLADSQLLQQRLNFVFTSGDALRASTDLSYKKFFNQVQTLQSGGQLINFFNSFGPNIKISLSEFFDMINPIEGTALSNQTLPGESESVFLEKKEYVFDTSVVTFDLGEVQGLETSVALDFFFNILKIGYVPQQYDEKAGKYEYNTTAQWQAPIKTIAKILDLICHARTDSYGFDYTRYNTAGGKSTTFNNSDNSVFLANVDREISAFDTFIADVNANLILLTNRNEQGISQARITGNYFSPFSDPCMFVFNQAAPGSFTVTTTLTGFLNGLPGDTLIINVRVNGVIKGSKTYTVVSSQVNFTSETIVFTQAFAEGDTIYISTQTSANGEGQLTVVSLNIPLYFAAINGGLINVVPGSFEQPTTLINVSDLRPSPGPYLPLSSALPILIFNDQLAMPNFNGTIGYGGQIQGGGADTLTIKCYINGAIFSFNTFPATTVTSNFSTFFDFNRDFALGDIVFFTASTTSGCNVTLQTCTLFLASTQILVYDLKRRVYDSITGIPNPESAFNIEDLTPKRMLLNNGRFLKSMLFNLAPDKLTFLTLDKNQYLSTLADGRLITENADVSLDELGDPLFYPLFFEFKTKVPLNFSKLLSFAANGHIKFRYNGKTFYGFPFEVTQKPAIEESQTWKLLCSPLTNLNDLVDLDIDGLNYLTLMGNDSFISHLCPVKFVPMDTTLNPKYHFVHMDDAWFINQVKFWIHKSNYFQPWQINDTIPLQVITGGIGPVQVDIYDCNAKLVYTTNMAVVPTSALQGTSVLYDLSLNSTSIGLTEGVYYIVYTIGTKKYISEGQYIKADWPMTLLVNYKHKTNKQSMIFSEGYSPNIRIHGWIDQFNPEGKFAVYEDQPADLEMLNGIPYRSHKLNIALTTGVQGVGVPDWVTDKMNRIMFLNNTIFDGLAFTRDGDVKWEVKKSEGWPKRYWSLSIRPATNRDGITQTADGLDQNVTVVYNIDGNAFGDDPGLNIIQITQED
jgi:hypothetical protein